VGLGFQFLAAGQRTEANAAFGAGGFRYGRMMRASEAFAELVVAAVGVAKVGATALQEARIYITYVFRNRAGQVVYVGRASGWGTPLKTLWERIRRTKAEEVARKNPHLKPEVIAQHASRDASMGSEAMNHDYFREPNAAATRRNS
jgi:hypothetical protein